MIRAAASVRRVVVMLLVVLPTAAAPALAATEPRADFYDVEAAVMCVTCNVPLNIAESPQATDEREEIKRLIAEGLTKEQILDRLVVEYGEQVLADPPTDGFNVTTWAVPVGAVGGVGLLLALALPRWRRRAQDDAGAAALAVPALSSADLRRLDEDLAAGER